MKGVPYKRANDSLESDFSGAYISMLFSQRIDREEWDGNNPARSGTGVAGPDVSAQPAYHLARLADVCPIEPGQPCFERYLATSRAQGGSDEAVTVLQSTVLLPPE